MSWIIYLVLFAFAIYTSYNFAALSLFGTPASLNNTYYLYKERSKWQRFLFPSMMVCMAGFLMPAWLEISEGSNFQFCSFLTAAGIIFTGMAPAFKDDQLTNRVHTISAIFAAVFAILWIVLVAKLWWFIVVWCIIVVLIALLTKTLKSGLTYWLETIAFMSTFTSIIAYFITK
jgi:hypothetical protein